MPGLNGYWPRLSELIAIMGDVASSAVHLIADGILRGHPGHGLAQVRRDLVGVLGANVRSQAGNVRRRHGGTRHVGHAATRLCGDDGHSRGVDVDDGAVVGHVVAEVALAHAANGANIGGRGGREVSRVPVVVAGSDGHEDAVVGHVAGRLVQGGRERAAEGAADDDAFRTVAPGRVLQDKVIGSNQVRGTEAVVSIDDLDAIHGGFLGDAKAEGANGAGAVRAVAVVIVVDAGDKALDLVGAALELL
ncbi:hypothetical protein HC256_000530 [Beauveria bassiana]|nr:hypothetical protein HC256_000530 [Beauveria bassiana]KAH8720124.1 hypothetical protein HC256_000530 [Beauveria bassiana]